MTAKQNVFLALGRDVPLVRLRNDVAHISIPFGNCDHMLRSPDRQYVRAVAGKICGITDGEVYLGGGVTEGWFFNGEKDYSDIDLLAVLNSNVPESSGLIHDLVRASQEQSGILVGTGLCGVKHIVEGERLYFNIDFVEERFSLIPIAKNRDPAKLLPSPIDLTIVSSKNFQRYLAKQERWS